jgi:c-di-AMP phosphodiesterase-like protein
MRQFDTEFRSLSYIISKAERILLFAHSRPDPDTVGANLALEEYLLSLGKHVDIACLNPFPDTLKGLAERTFLHPDQLISIVMTLSSAAMKIEASILS